MKADQEVDLNERNVARLQEHVAAAKVRLEAGAATMTQVAQAEARLSRARTTLISAITSRGNAEDSFTTLTGIPAGDLEADVDAGALPTTLLEADEMARQIIRPLRLQTSPLQRLISSSIRYLRA